MYLLFSREKKRADRMHTSDWMNVISQIPANSRITLTGGEPLVYKDFKEIFVRANQIGETNIVTNGLLLDNENINLLLKEKNFKVLESLLIILEIQIEISNQNNGTNSNNNSILLYRREIS